MSDVTPSAPPASQAVMAVGRHRLSAAARVGPDQRSTQAQADGYAQLLISKAQPE
jgi:uncharacterized protein (DUF1015 family)